MRPVRLFAPLLLGLLIGTVGLYAAPRGAHHLIFLHTSDTHGHLRPFSYPTVFDAASPLGQLPQRRNIGGIARRASLVRSVRRAEGARVLLVDCGDFCDGTPFSTEYHGEADIAAMNEAGYDVACPGNHEFSNRLPELRRVLSKARFPFVCANATTINGEQLFRPYVIRTVDHVRVAIFGLLTPDARRYPGAQDGVRIEPPVRVAHTLVRRLRKEADIVVALTHLGYAEDRTLAQAVEGIDIILGGHSHTFLRGGARVRSVHGNPAYGTVIAHPFEWGAVLGRLDVRVDRMSSSAWALVAHKSAYLPVTSAVKLDPAVTRVVERYWKPIRSRYDRPIGFAVLDFTRKGPDYAEYHLVADAVREATGAEVALENVGGVRARLVQGRITYGDLVTMDPFGNTIVIMKLTGRHLREVLARRRPAVSGIRYAVEGSRVQRATVGGEPLDDDRIYVVATNSYFARDEVFRGAVDREERQDTRLGAIIRYIKRRGRVSPSYDGRRIVRGVQDEF